ncbi:MAG: type IV pili methyl-accepting chemotaxis transducer N-terminal domain-containing protein [Bdellovibrionota bacterium]
MSSALGEEHNESSVTSEQLSTLINISGRQRMLCQRIAFLILDSVFSNDSSLLEELDKAIVLFSDTHKLLVEGSEEKKLPGLFSELLKQIFLGSKKDANNLVLRFIEQAQEICDDLKIGKEVEKSRLLVLLENSRKPMLSLLNDITNAYQQESELFAERQRQEVEKKRDQVKSMLKNIQLVAREAKIISFNTHVIASRLGPSGREVNAVGKAMETLNSEINNTVAKILCEYS